MCYLLIDCLYLERVYFLHLGCDQHGLHSNQMKFGRGQAFSLSLEVSVHKADPIKIGFITEFIGVVDFHHPIQHPCAKGSID